MATKSGGSRSSTALITATLLVIITAAAAIIRLAQLDAQPGGLFADEAAEGLDAARLLRDPNYNPIFLTGNAGREALYASIVAQAFRFFGPSVVTLRGTSAVLGIIAVPAFYVVARRFGRPAALIAAAWSAGSLWLIATDRFGTRNAIVPLFEALAFAGLFYWSAKPTRRLAYLAGAMAALCSFYTYQPMKLMPFLILFWLMWIRRHQPENYGKLQPTLPHFIAAYLIVAAPMLIFAVMNPVDYLGRAIAVTVENRNPYSDSNYAIHIIKALGMFTIAGDPNQRQDVNGVPMLGWPLFFIAIIGIIRLRRYRTPSSRLVFWALPIFFLPPVVAIEGGSPDFLRALGLSVPIAICIGCGCAEIYQYARALKYKLAPAATLIAVAAGLCALALASEYTYFSRPVAARYQPFSFDVVQLAQLAHQGPGTIVIMDPGDPNYWVIEFLDSDNMPTVIKPGERIPRPELYSAVYSFQPYYILLATDKSTADHSFPVAYDPQHHPSVWEAVP